MPDQLSSEPNDPLVPVFIPALAPLLVRAEELKGSPLTETDVLRIRDNAVCVVLPLSHKQAVEESRGYADINAENCWEEWQQLRQEMQAPAPPPGPEGPG